MNRTRLIIVLAVLTAGTALRFWLSTFGHNFDYDSFLIARDILREGGNVYAETTRYNYAPGWFLIIRALDLLSGGSEPLFRGLMVALLTLADMGIAALIGRRYGFW